MGTDSGIDGNSILKTEIYPFILGFWKLIKETYKDTFTQEDIDVTLACCGKFQQMYVNTDLRPLVDECVKGYLNFIDRQFRKAMR